MSLHRLIRLCALFCGAILLVALAAGGVSAQGAGAPNAASAASVRESSPDMDYQLGSGDKIRVSVFGQKDLDGEYVVDGTGRVQLPLIGQIDAAGLTVAAFQREVTAKLANGYLVNPSVSIEVVTYRPFYIIGEVNKPGEYPYVSGMSVLNAVALAGGYTFRANDSEVYIRRKGATKEKEFPADETTKIDPGDIIRVPERFF
jgi:polysaccharide export outer membrane protein